MEVGSIRLVLYLLHFLHAKVSRGPQNLLGAVRSAHALFSVDSTRLSARSSLSGEVVSEITTTLTPDDLADEFLITLS